MNWIILVVGLFETLCLPHLSLVGKLSKRQSYFQKFKKNSLINLIESRRVWLHNKRLQKTEKKIQLNRKSNHLEQHVTQQ